MKKLLLIILSTFIIFSCDLFSKSDFLQEMKDEITTEIHFYSCKEDVGTPKVITKSYPIGKTLYANDLPQFDDGEFSDWSTSQRIGGWNFYRYTDSTDSVLQYRIESLVVPLSPIDLYASWHNKYTVKIYYENLPVETVKDLSTYELSQSENFDEAGTSVAIDYTEYQKEGFEFDSSQSLLSGTITEDNLLTLTAVFNRKNITITLDAVDGTFASNSLATIDYSGFFGEEIPEFEIPVKDDYVFEKWDVSVGTTFPSSDVTLTAIYKEVPPTGIIVNPVDPAFTSYKLGKLQTSALVIATSPSDTKTNYYITSDAYQYIKEDTSDGLKYVYYHFGGAVAKASIVANTGSNSTQYPFLAEINLSNMNVVSGSQPAIVSGIYNIVFTCDAIDGIMFENNEEQLILY